MPALSRVGEALGERVHGHDRGPVSAAIPEGLQTCDAFGTIRRMQGGVASRTVDIRVDAGRTASIARFVSRQTILAAFVVVIAVVFHVTGSTGPGSAANQSVLALAVLIGQINMPRRQFRHLLRGTPTTVFATAVEPFTLH
jgi:hypothetical protein